MMNKEKLCCICKQIKSTFEFYKSKQSKDGFDFHCKQCDKEKKLKVELQCSCCDNKFKGTYKQQLDDFVRNVNHDNTELTKETKESLAM